MGRGTALADERGVSSLRVALTSFALTALSLSSLAVAACGGRVGDGIEPIPDGGAGADAGGGPSADGAAPADGGSTGKADGGASKVCPPKAPFQNDLCTVEGLECEYGDSYRLRCNVLAACRGGRWALTAPDTVVCGSPLNGPSCPASRGAVKDGEICPLEGAACVYPQGVCECSAFGSPGREPAWACFPEKANGACPFPRPELGTECTEAGLTCDYSTCANQIVCRGGLWHRGAGSPCE